MTLEQMEYFCELYRQRSITHAADALHISRQALSAMIKKLEDEFQTPLFVRQNNGILPTPACDKLYHHSLTVLTDYGVLKQSMQSHLQLKVDTPISIGLSSIILSHYGDKITKHLSETFPTASFIFSPLKNFQDEHNYQSYFSHDISIVCIEPDFYSFLNQSLPQHYTLCSIKEVSLYVWLSKNSPLANRKNLNVKELQTFSRLTYKNTFNEPLLPAFCNFQNVNLEYNFAKALEQGDACAPDVAINNQLLYQNLLQKSNTVAIPINVTTIITIVYHVSFQDLIPGIITLLK